MCLLWVAAVLATAGCNDNDDDGVFDGDRPGEPRDLLSFTGNEQVILVWGSPGGDVESYNVYAFIAQTGEFEVIGITTSTAFVDTDVVNGVTYRYRVTAVDFDGDESEFSVEVFDTPRPDGFNFLLTSVQSDPAGAAFDFAAARVVDGASPAAAFRFEELGGVARIVPVNGTEVLRLAEPIDQLGDINFAPESGYLPEPVQAFVGAGYVFRIPRAEGRFFAAVRVSHIAAGILVFDWAFQTDEGNRELLRRTRTD